MTHELQKEGSGPPEVFEGVIDTKKKTTAEKFDLEMRLCSYFMDVKLALQIRLNIHLQVTTTYT